MKNKVVMGYRAHPDKDTLAMALGMRELLMTASNSSTKQDWWRCTLKADSSVAPLLRNDNSLDQISCKNSKGTARAVPLFFSVKL